jgi:hypothetical protein
MSDLGPMTLGALQTTVGLVLRELGLGPRCWTKTLPQDDCVCGSFFIPQPTSPDREIIEKYFTILTQRYGWKPPVTAIDRRGNMITLTIQRDKPPGEIRRRMSL